MNSFERAESHLDALGVDAMKSVGLSMHRIEALCDALDNPQRKVPAIHVAGTNGKTSIARILSSLLTAAGLSVGTYTSPHLESIRERIALAGEPLSEAAFGNAFDHLFPYLEDVERQFGETLTYFEILTALFFLWSAEAPVDAIVVEVGLGGRWDATNVVPAGVAVLTNVGLDHTDLLGTDRPTIAREKAGVIKNETTVVCGERSPEIVALIEDEAQSQGSQVALLERDFSVRRNEVAVGGRVLSVTTSKADYDDVYLPLHGSHQGTNAALALEAIARFLALPLEQDIVEQGFALVRAPGRMETIRRDGRAVVLDVAHNPEGMSATISALAESFTFQTAAVVFGALSDKDYRGMLAEIARLNCRIVATAPASPRAVPPDEIARAAAEAGLEAVPIGDVGAAVDHAAGTATEGELVCVTGSHYVVGEARAHLLASTGRVGGGVSG